MKVYYYRDCVLHFNFLQLIASAFTYKKRIYKSFRHWISGF
ncbi:hypothetical protein BSPA14S_I0029 (plasmid) [Borreliella spielmanii A14S]|uniref:Uncharacterized protein n=1 Tax=Borreliella spielmanii A14S TaxID=498742 RepID=C0RCA8_9SPIR|nr:hypothetical protein BSPA14S_I0029 [Borreliella spielmanii A14S]